MVIDKVSLCIDTDDHMNICKYWHVIPLASLAPRAHVPYRLCERARRASGDNVYPLIVVSLYHYHLTAPLRGVSVLLCTRIPLRKLCHFLRSIFSSFF